MQHISDDNWREFALFIVLNACEEWVEIMEHRNPKSLPSDQLHSIERFISSDWCAFLLLGANTEITQSQIQTMMKMKRREIQKLNKENETCQSNQLYISRWER